MAQMEEGGCVHHYIDELCRIRHAAWASHWTLDRGIIHHSQSPPYQSSRALGVSASRSGSSWVCLTPPLSLSFAHAFLGSPIVSVLARKYGKRPQFLFAVVMGTIGTAVCIGAKTSYNTLLAGRILQGFGVTAWESLSLATIGDIFFLHERGWRTAVVVLTLACLASMVSIIGGVVAEHLGWRYLFIISLPFDLFGLLGTIFFLPETQFRRDPSLEYEQYLNNQSDRKTATEQSLQVNEESRQQDATESGRRSQSYLQSLRPFSGVYTDENPAILIIEIFIHLLNPAVMWILNVSAVLVVCFLPGSIALTSHN